MFIWIIIAAGALLIALIVVKIIKAMLKAEKESNKQQTNKQESENNNLNTPELDIDKPIVEDSSSNIDTSVDTNSPEISKEDWEEFNAKMREFDSLMADGGFTDHEDEEFFDYSKHLRNRKNNVKPPVQMDLEGDLADNFVYEPSAPELSYLNTHRQRNIKKSTKTSLNNLPDEIKVLMISNLFDKKF